MLFIISQSKNLSMNSGYFYWNKNYLANYEKLSEEELNNILKIDSAILFFNKAIDKLKNSVQLVITKVELNKNYLKLYYVVSKELEFKSYLIRDALKQYFNAKSVYDLPFVAFVDSEEFIRKISDRKIFSEIYQLEQKNDWQAIYNLMLDNFPLEAKSIWDNSDLLNRFAFATSKLSECTENLKRKFPDNNKRKKFISEKRHFRDLTIKLRNRIIELKPDYAPYYSNLAYSYYLSLNELTTRGGRRDGDINSEAEKALIYLDKAVQLDKNRIVDFYRKAMILSEILANNMAFSANDELPMTEKLNRYFNYLSSGVNEFLNVIKIYENFSNEVDRKRFKKNYVKSLYHIAQLNLKLSKVSANYFYFISKINGKNPFRDNKFSNNFLMNSISNIDKCIRNDYNKKREEKELIELVDCNNFICGVFKAYLKGVISLSCFIQTEDNKFKKEAEMFLDKALELNFPPEMQNQNKLFILEKKAQLAMVNQQYSAAIKTLEIPYNKKPNFPSYAAFTLAIAYLLDNDNEKAKEICNRYLNKENDLMKNKFTYLLSQINKQEEENQSLYEKGMQEVQSIIDNMNELWAKYKNDELEDPPDL